MRYDLIIFDMDGTVLDTLRDLTESANHALRVCGFPERTIDEVRSFVGNGIANLIKRCVPEETCEEKCREVHKAFTAHYTEHCSDNTKPYNGIPELLMKLRESGCKTAVVSNKADYAVQKLCQQFFPEMFDAAAGEQMPKYPKKPSPELVYMIMDKLGCSKEQTVYIGDSDVDIMTARNAGTDCIAVEWGFRSREFLLEHGAKTIVSDVSSLERLLTENPQ